MNADEHSLDTVGDGQIGVDDFLARAHILLEGPARYGGEVEHLELVAHVAQDGFLKLSVISQAAGPRELDQHVRAGIEGLHVIAEDVLERCADEVVALRGAPLEGLPICFGQADELGVEDVLYEESEGYVVVAVAEKRDACLSVALSLAALALRHESGGAAVLLAHGRACLRAFVVATAERVEGIERVSEEIRGAKGQGVVRAYGRARIRRAIFRGGHRR